MLLRVRVKPGAKQPRIEAGPDGSLTAWLKSPPVEGRANHELIEALAARFGVPKSRVRIKTGAASRIKLIEVD